MPIFKKNGWWYAKIDKGGVKWTPKKIGMDPSRWRTMREARRGEAELRQRIESARTTATSLDLLTLCNEYLRDVKASCVGHDTFALKNRFCKEILERWGNSPAEEVTVHMAQSYLLERADRVSNNSFNVYRQEGKRLFNWAVRQQLLPKDFSNPFAEVDKKRHEKGKPRPAVIEDVIKVYMAADPDQKDLILTYLVTGARKSEILKWEWSDIDFDNRILWLSS